MKNLGVLLFGLVTVLPVYAQDPPAADAAAPAETAPADAATPAPDAAAAPASGEAPAAETAAAAPAAPDAAAAPAEAPADAAAAAPAEAVPAATETAAAESAPAESQSERKPWKLYAGYDYTHINMQISTSNPPAQSPMQTQFGGDFFTTNFHQVRGGVRLFDVIGLEAHLGLKSDDGDKVGNNTGKISLKHYGGIYLAPTGTILETVELSALIGYSYMKVVRPGAEAKLKGMSYGINMELPIRLFSDALPDLRFGGGIMMYQRNSESRTYGVHFGLRYDFKI